MKVEVVVTWAPRPNYAKPYGFSGDIKQQLKKNNFSPSLQTDVTVHDVTQSCARLNFEKQLGAWVRLTQAICLPKTNQTKVDTDISPGVTGDLDASVLCQSVPECTTVAAAKTKFIQSQP